MTLSLTSWLQFQKVLLRSLKLTLPDVVIFHGILQLVQSFQGLAMPIRCSICSTVTCRAAALIHKVQLLGCLGQCLAEAFRSARGILCCLCSAFDRAVESLVCDGQAMLLLQKLVLQRGEALVGLVQSLLCSRFFTPGLSQLRPLVLQGFFGSQTSILEGVQ
eukprot:Skav201630  [mRNA]  locus=scaffold3582:100557:106115:+ [translate_table: standard]